jgi:membrane protein implicated in regulation of membrane protease activity
MAWWVWVLVGLLLLIEEIFVPLDFFLFFIGLAALAVGAATSAGWVTDPWMQVTAFAVLSASFFFFLRRPLINRLATRSEGQAEPGSLLGQSLVLPVSLEPGDVGQAELRGTRWSVRTDGGRIEASTRCRIDRVDGLTLWISPETTTNP